MNNDAISRFQCPAPLKRDTIVLAHGGGGSLMNQLIEKIFIGALSNPILDQRHDSAVLKLSASRIAFTTDSFVVRPLFFKGGDIGTLAVNGTVNDLAMSGARPLFLSLGIIIEEGFEIKLLEQITHSIAEAARIACVQIVTGDTKVVDRGKGDGIYINTAGIGTIEHSLEILPTRIQPGDALLLSGDIGRHGVAVMAQRDGLSFETAIESDCAPVSSTVLDLINAGVEIHCLRDLTRGGLASALAEIATASKLGIQFEERAIPVEPAVQSACELLGIDPIYVANEGRFIAFVAEKDAQKATTILKRYHHQATRIGSVSTQTPATVTVLSSIGIRRVVTLLSGEQLPRIC